MTPWKKTRRLLPVLALAALGPGCKDDVIPPNQLPIMASVIPAQTLVADSAVTFDLSGYFGDPDGDVLAYAAASGDTAVAAAGVMGDTLTIRGVRQGARHGGCGHGGEPAPGRCRLDPRAGACGRQCRDLRPVRLLRRSGRGCSGLRGRERRHRRGCRRGHGRHADDSRGEAGSHGGHGHGLRSGRAVGQPERCGHGGEPAPGRCRLDPRADARGRGAP